MTSYRLQSDVIGTSFFPVAMVTDLYRHLIYDSRGALHARIIIEKLSEIHTLEKCDFLKSIIHFQKN